MNLDNVMAFLPGSQLDIRPIRDVDHLMKVDQPYLIVRWIVHVEILLYLDVILDQSTSGQRAETLAGLEVKVRRLLVLFKTLQITVLSWILVVLTDCCTLQIFHGDV